MRFHPDQKLKCLLIQPPFEGQSFWTFTKTYEIAGCKAVSPPLGLLTVAALLPQHWEFKLLDLNCTPFDHELWNWADLVCTSGMLPQQPGILEVIDRGARDGKFVAVGGPDPTSQPDIYERASALVLNEGEITIPMWLESWRESRPAGMFTACEKPDLTRTPIPRFDLVKLRDYLTLGIQISRGCPFDCEFCDVIELYGRQPRLKTPQQVVAELEALFQLGYSGALDIVDDNFIGNKSYIKREILPAMIAWMKERRYPFYLSTEASINLADDVELMKMMRDAEFRQVFIGVETSDPELMLNMRKNRPRAGSITERVHRIHEYGMVVFAGFILGFDNEPDGMDASIIRCVEESGIIIAMIGLLIALPETQLTRRLRREGRLIGADGKMDVNRGRYRLDYAHLAFERCDQTTSGLNFVTTRDRRTILRECLEAIKAVYDADTYFKRVVRTFSRVKYERHYFPRWSEIRRYLRGAFFLPLKLLFSGDTCWPYLRTAMRAVWFGPTGYINTMKMLTIYVDLKQRRDEVAASIERRLRDMEDGSVPFQITELEEHPEKPATVPLG